MKNSIIWISIILGILLFMPLVIVIYDYWYKKYTGYDCMSVDEIDYQRYQHLVDWTKP